MSDWSLRKAEFTHDWLKNELLVFLGGIRNVALEKVVDPLAIIKLNKVIEAWNARQIEAFELIDSFENEMSPVIYFKIKPLSNCDSVQTEILSDIIHGSWLRKYPVKQWLSTAFIELDNTNKAFEEAHKYFSHKSQSSPTPEDANAIDVLEKSVLALTEALNKLPSRIMI